MNPKRFLIATLLYMLGPRQMAFLQKALKLTRIKCVVSKYYRIVKLKGCVSVLKEVNIQGYRAIDKFNLELSKVNVLVGRNNTGKSSILEAIAILLSSCHKFKNPLTGESLLGYLAEIRGGYQYLINVNSTCAIVSATMENNSTLCTRMFLKEKLPAMSSKDQKTLWNAIREIAEKDIERSIEKLKEEIRLFEERLSSITSKTLREKYTTRLEELEKKLRRYSLDKNSILNERVNDILRRVRFAALSYYNDVALSAYIHFTSTHTRTMNTEDEWSMFFELPFLFEFPSEFITSFRRTPSDIKFYARLVGKLSLLLDKLDVGMLIKVLDKLRNIVPYFQDYRDGSVVFNYSKRLEIIPLSSTGEGFQALLELLPPVLLGAKVIIIEEPEVHLHPGFMEKYSLEMLKMVKDYNVQFIVSTHSLEFLRDLLMNARQMGVINDIKFVRMYRHYSTGELDYEILSGEESYEELESLGGDLRGP
ncbi:MAG TPA: DUF2813 domain-containing protein [Thermoproteales archaeon]|nr:DUF2813 domain-containing protein [Thermoproteales archaeon]